MSDVLGRFGVPVDQPFTVVDSAGSPVTGLLDANFVKELFDPDAFFNSVPVVVSELGSGSYTASFTPDKVGTWYLVVKHSTHFPEGKSGGIQVYEGDLSQVDDNNQVLKNRTVTNPITGIKTVYERDDVTPRETAPIWEDVAETQPYRGRGIDSEGRLT